MTEKEKLMYQIIGNISESDAPIVFKGALVTKLILAENGYSALERQTKDIDANWVGVPPSMADLTNLVNRSLDSFGGKLRAEAIREYGDKKSAGIAIMETATNNRVVTIDMSIKSVHGSRYYNYGEIKIKGVLVNEILSDKITVLSKSTIFRRAKDIVDVYALTHCVEVNTSEIYELFAKTPNREVGTFDEFYNRKQEIEHAYRNLSGIDGKPSFDDVYAYLKKFIQPFAEKDMKPKIWISNHTTWKDTKPSILETLRKYEMGIAKKDNETEDNCSPSKNKDESIDL